MKKNGIYVFMARGLIAVIVTAMVIGIIIKKKQPTKSQREKVQNGKYYFKTSTPKILI